jgi:hypothetical protein
LLSTDCFWEVTTLLIDRLAGFIIVQNNPYVLDLLAMEIDFQCPFDWHKFVIICRLKSNILSTIISTTNRPISFLITQLQRN